jgi:hypothetical protein
LETAFIFCTLATTVWKNLIGLWAVDELLILNLRDFGVVDVL